MAVVWEDVTQINILGSVSGFILARLIHPVTARKMSSVIGGRRLGGLCSPCNEGAISH